MDFIMVTGLSGAGKSSSIAILEDMGFYCIDNIALESILNIYELYSSSKDLSGKILAFIIDIPYGNDILKILSHTINLLYNDNLKFKILFLEAENETILNRFKDPKKNHPLANIYNISIEQAIALERSMLTPLRELSDYTIDTSFLCSEQLRNRLLNIFFAETKNDFTVNCISFGFKYGVPLSSNLVFDVRCFKNPYHDIQLREFNGTNQKIKQFVIKNKDTQIFLDKMFSLLEFTLPLYEKKGKSQFMIAIGCTGGRHRSVAIVGCLHEHLTSLGYNSNVFHRDIKKIKTLKR